MKYFRGVSVVAALLSLVAFTGCEIDATNGSSTNTSNQNPLMGDTSTVSTDTSAQAAPPATDPNLVYTGDELDISNAQDYGRHAGRPAKNATVTRRLHAASIQGDNVVLSFDDLNWPSIGDGKKVDGGVYIYWYEGSQVVGGHFDWHGVGQTAKTLANIGGGYLDGHRPPRGATVYFVLVNLDGNERTNVKTSSNTW